MTPDDILKGLYDETMLGNAPAVLDLTRQGLDMGMGPDQILFEALIPALEEVGARFERGDFFVPEMLIAGRAMSGALELLRPLLADSGAETVGTFLMGTVKGDVHDIGKNLVDIMLEGAGFDVIDIGVQVAPETFIEAIEEHKPDVVGLSAFLTTTMPMFKVNINAIEKAGLRDDVIIMVGGAPVTQEYADVVRGRRLRGRRATAVPPRQGPHRAGRRRRLTQANRHGPPPAIEHAVKKPVFDCRMCGQCVLHSTGHDLPDDLPEDAPERPVRRCARERALRGEARDALCLAEGGGAHAHDAAAAGLVARGISTTCDLRSTTG